MTGRPSTVLAVTAAGVLLVCGLPFVVAIPAQVPAEACGSGPAGGSTGGTPTTVQTAASAPLPGKLTGRWSAEQLSNAAVIVATGQRLAVPPRGWVIAVATAMQESSLHNHGYLGAANDADSLGLFQQRPSQGWGSPAQLMDPVYAATQFYRRLLTVPDWQSKPLTEAAQTVQRSAYPDAYQRWELDAEAVVAHVTGHASVTEIPGASLVACGPPSVIGAGGWTQPVVAQVVSGYGPRGGRLHAGVDLGAARNTVIKAASAGTVVWVGCDRHTGNCDVDGSPDVRGCGWFVDILHVNRVATRYCHMTRRPDVATGQKVGAGQEIGIVGSSGNSSGPHLHFEVHTNVSCRGTDCDIGNDNSTDPVPFMRQACAPIGVVPAPTNPC